PGCALHQAALQRGHRPLDYKPEVCWQLPLRREDHEEDDGHVTSTIIEWQRRHWGDGGQEFHWWCTEAPEAFVARDPVYRTMRDELIELVGKRVYARVAEYLDARDAKPVAFLPHPTATGGVRQINVEVGQYPSGDAFTLAGCLRGRAMTPAEVLDWWTGAAARNRAALRGLDPAARVPWGLGMGLRAFGAARIMEHW